MTDTETTPTTTAPPPIDEAELYRKFLAKQAEFRAQRQHEERVEGDRIHHETEKRIALALGAQANDGSGHCRWCGIVLGADGSGNRTHPPLRECPGPAPDPCGLCRRPWTWDRERIRWAHDCTGRAIGAPRARDVERVHSPGGGEQGAFGYRRGES